MLRSQRLDRGQWEFRLVQFPFGLVVMAGELVSGEIVRLGVGGRWWVRGKFMGEVKAIG